MVTSWVYYVLLVATLSALVVAAWCFWKSVQIKQPRDSNNPLLLGGVGLISFSMAIGFLNQTQGFYKPKDPEGARQLVEGFAMIGVLSWLAGVIFTYIAVSEYRNGR